MGLLLIMNHAAVQFVFALFADSELLVYKIVGRKDKTIYAIQVLWYSLIVRMDQSVTLLLKSLRVLSAIDGVEKYGDGVEEWWHVEGSWEHVGRKGKEKAREDCCSRGSYEDETIQRITPGAVANLEMNEFNQELIMAQSAIGLLAMTASDREEQLSRVNDFFWPWTFFEGLLEFPLSHDNDFKGYLMTWWSNFRPTSIVGVLCKLVPTLVSRNIWKGRNRRIYDGHKITSAQIIHDVVAAIKSITLAYPFLVQDARDQRLVRTDYIAPNLNFKPPRVLSLAWTSPP
ncbi:hypothetical protein ACH5RR_037099 [Cinchona calisaya]|uniref:Uncharacterized protein n=1 Tax=Cinchona calisaya TaxID=153742 RepID=A0ABD2Y8Y2_9GENT